MGLGGRRKRALSRSPVGAPWRLSSPVRVLVERGQMAGAPGAQVRQDTASAFLRFLCHRRGGRASRGNGPHPARGHEPQPNTQTFASASFHPSRTPPLLPSVPNPSSAALVCRPRQPLALTAGNGWKCPLLPCAVGHPLRSLFIPWGHQFPPGAPPRLATVVFFSFSSFPPLPPLCPWSFTKRRRDHGTHADAPAAGHGGVWGRGRDWRLLVKTRHGPHRRGKSPMRGETDSCCAHPMGTLSRVSPGELAAALVAAALVAELV